LQARQQPTNGEGSHRPDRQHLAQMPFLEPVEGLADAIKGLAHHRKQGFALFGDHQAAR
jgi:hypothetical protein